MGFSSPHRPRSRFGVRFFQYFQATQLYDKLEALMEKNDLQWNEMFSQRSIRRTIRESLCVLVSKILGRIYPTTGSRFDGWIFKFRSRIPLVYGYYVVMGGFAVNTETESSPPHQPVTKTRTTATCAGLITLPRAGVALKIDRETFNDKSKADVLAKVFVIFQAIWMVMQVNSIPLLKKSLGCVDSLSRLLPSRIWVYRSHFWKYIHLCMYSAPGLCIAFGLRSPLGY